MSKEAIQEVLQALEALPEADQRLVLNFVAGLKQQHRANGSSETGSNPALTMKEGLLIFTGKLDMPERDWVQWEREEHDKELVQMALRRSSAHEGLLRYERVGRGLFRRPRPPHVREKSA